MLSGALIGGIIGVVLVFMQLAKQKSGGKRMVQALAHGTTQARAALDAYVKPPVGKIAVQRLPMLQERFAWLAIIGAHDDLERELVGITGHVSVVGQLRALGAVGLLAHRAEARDLETLRQTSAFVDAEGGAMLRLVKSILHDLVTVASARAGASLDLEVTRRVYERATKSPVATKIVMLRFLARMAEAAGTNGATFQREADEALAKLG